MSDNDGDVIIVGAGMVGASLALLLGEAGWSVELLDAGEPVADIDTLGEGAPSLRVSALTAASRRLLGSLGVWPSLESRRVSPYQGMAVWDAEGSGEIRFDAGTVGESALGHIVENELLQAALTRRLEALPNVRLRHGVRLVGYRREAGEAVVGLDNATERRPETIRAPLIVGADGGRSPLRSLAGIPVCETQTGQAAMVTSVRTEHGHGGIARQVFLATGPLAFLPLMIDGRDDHCSIVWSTTPEAASRMTSLAGDEAGRADLGHMLTRAIGERLGRVDVIDAAPHFPIAQRHAGRYVDDGLALVGDAAHSLHPLAGQGVNLGLMDAAVLAEEWIRAKQRGAEPGDPRIMARYERRRRSENAAMLAAMQGFQRLFGSRQPALRLARNWGLAGLDRLSPVKRLLIRQALGEYGDLPARCRA
ncbi:UbiH/UbiF/VisC/COQ6 family ubiquinone biosynthesis hydroxylase [Salinicola rhizosphaerae]|uniref:2-octaprenyl-3-methyl-6-methoxy-1,4-benzoquinol hydroxylase n=1 Tax=Salinicola rhizosphaerae TaxID=1443141 RepID=A0ABQ3DVN6_9GAMM|nr:UbiH/UbiF/VisC/COQ6 family ubiquinone biosynthesis hydroxylase [Salinicola rhizosphaerae]GHB14517.1 2-octaprenyl-3-methyl-6-methoxy-1,4-benzoquinol hydroxylase [Salinicola rhizosphaerae]